MAGYGNKSAASPNFNEAQEFRFDMKDNCDPYMGSNEYGSGTTGGAGWGNKTGSHHDSSDSPVGKLVQKAGQVMHNQKVEDKGAEMRESKGYVGGAGGGGEIQGGVDGEAGRKWNE